jgi:hypothetical protein
MQPLTLNKCKFVNMIKNILYLIAFTAALSSCLDRKNSPTEILKGFEKFVNDEQIKLISVTSNSCKELVVPGDIDDSVLELKNIIEDIKYVHLETNNNSLIGGIDKMFSFGNRIIVVDQRLAEGVFIFDQTGKFIKAIKNKGKGPGEFSTIRDVSVDTLHNNILLLDDYAAKVNVYSMNGEFINDIRLSYYFRQFVYLKDSLFVTYNGDDINRHLSKIKDMKIVVSKAIQGIHFAGHPFVDRFPKIEIGNRDHLVSGYEDVLFTPDLSDTIYAVHSQGIRAKYRLNLGSNGVINHLTEQTNDDQYLEMINSGKYNRYKNIIESRKFLYLEIGGKNGSINHLFYSKDKDEFFYGSRLIFAGLRNLLIFNRPISYQGNSFISVINSHEISRVIKNIKSRPDKSVNDYDKEFFSRMELVTENDNPVLMFFTLKNSKL